MRSYSFPRRWFPFALLPQRGSMTAAPGDVTRTGTSISGPTTPARGSPDVAPNTPIATGIASSKLFEAAESAGVAVRA
jgi:hypothetical protein